MEPDQEGREPREEEAEEGGVEGSVTVGQVANDYTRDNPHRADDGDHECPLGGWEADYRGCVGRG